MKNLRKAYDVLSKSVGATSNILIVTVVVSFVLTLISSALSDTVSSIIIYGIQVVLLVNNIIFPIALSRAIAHRLNFSRKIGVVLPIVFYLVVSFLYIPVFGLVIESQYIIPYYILNTIIFPYIFTIFTLVLWRRLFKKMQSSQKVKNRIIYCIGVLTMLLIVTPIYFGILTVHANIEAFYLSGGVVVGLYEGLFASLGYLTGTDVLNYYSTYISYYNQTDMYLYTFAVLLITNIGVLGVGVATMYYVKPIKERIIIFVILIVTLLTGTQSLMLIGIGIKYKKPLVSLVVSGGLVGIVVGLFNLPITELPQYTFYIQNLLGSFAGQELKLCLVILIAILINVILTIVVMQYDFLSERKKIK